MSPRSYRKYDQSFRDDAVEMLLRGDRTEREVASALGVPKPTLRNWYTVSMARVGKKARGGTGGRAQTERSVESTEDKVRRLERELTNANRKIAVLEMDRAILKKAAAFFAKESE